MLRDVKLFVRDKITRENQQVKNQFCIQNFPFF
jgi:hypothetical protein